MSEFAEGMAVGQSIGGRDGGCYGYGYPMMPVMPAYGGYGMGGYGMGGFGYGNDWWILLLLFCGWGNGVWGRNGDNGALNYELGKVATTNDVASGFSTSAIMSNQRDIQLGQQQGFADVQQTLCQGFSGVNQTLMNGFHGVDNAICTLGYQNHNDFNNLSHQLSDCCCDLKTMNLENRYLNEKQTCDIIQASNANTQRVIDYLTCKENQTLRDDLQAARFQLSQLSQNSYLVNELRPTARPAYLTCSPFESAYGWNRYDYGRNGGCYQNSCCCG